MILQELVRYYDRAGDLAPEGWEWKRIPYLIEIRADGSFIQLTSLRSGPKSTDVKPSLVPKSENRQGTKAYEKPNLLWDHHGFVLAHPKSNNPKDVLAAQRQHEHFVKRIETLIASGAEDTGLQAVSRFLASDARLNVQDDPLWSECAKVAGCNLAFRLVGDDVLVAQRDAVRAAIDRTSQKVKGSASDASDQALCLVTGELATIQALHSPIAGVCEKPSPMAAVNDGVSPAYSSFGKSQGFNFPVGETAVFKYTTALNRLLQPGSRQRIKMGDTATVFWAQSTEDADIENSFAALFDDVPDDPNAHTNQVRALFSSIQSGRFDGAPGDRRFFVLGLAPNSARVVVRFWQGAALRDVAQRIKWWFDDIEIEHANYEPEHLPVRRLLAAACLTTKEMPHGDLKKLPPAIAGDLVRAILTGGEIPALLLNGVIQRCRAEQARKDDKGKPVKHVTYARAALMRAAINRYRRFHQPHLRSISMSLDQDLPDPPYALGRLFAVYERTQEAAAGRDLNKTIRDAFFGAAMSTPASVFPRLMRLNQIHLRDVKRSQPGYGVYLDKLILAINDKINPSSNYPRVLALQEQAQFALGYYHQRQAFFTKADATPEAAPADTTPTASN